MSCHSIYNLINLQINIILLCYYLNIYFIYLIYFLFNHLIYVTIVCIKRKKKAKKEFVSLDDDQAEKLMLT